MTITRLSQLIIPETGKTIRETNMELKHNIPLGSVVEVELDDYYGQQENEEVFIGGTAHLIVVYRGRDCDGTPLYWLGTKEPPQDFKGGPNGLIAKLWIEQRGGYSEENLKLIKTPEQLKDYRNGSE